MSERPIVSKCQSELCGNLIWRDGYKHGNGKYCDSYCASDARRFAGLEIEYKRSLTNPKKTVKTFVEEIVENPNIFPHKNLPIQLILD